MEQRSILHMASRLSNDNLIMEMVRKARQHNTTRMKQPFLAASGEI